MQLNDVFHAVFSDFDGNGSETVFYAVRTVKVNGAGEDLVFIMVNRADQLCCRRGDAEFSAAFCRIFDISFLVDFVENDFFGVHMIKPRPFCEEFIDRFAGDCYMAPGNHGTVPVFT